MSLQNYTSICPVARPNSGFKSKSPLFSLKRYSNQTKEQLAQETQKQQSGSEIDQTNLSSQYYTLNQTKLNQSKQEGIVRNLNTSQDINSKTKKNSSSSGRLVSYQARRDEKKVNKSQSSRSQSQSQFIDQEQKDAYLTAFDETTPKPLLLRPKQQSLHERRQTQNDYKMNSQTPQIVEKYDKKMPIIVEDVSNYADKTQVAKHQDLNELKEQLEKQQQDIEMQRSLQQINIESFDSNSPQLKLENLVNLWSKIKSAHQDINNSRENSKDRKALKYFNKNLHIEAPMVNIDKVELKKANSTQNQNICSINHGILTDEYCNLNYQRNYENTSQQDLSALNNSHFEALQPRVNDPQKIQKSLALLKSRQLSTNNRTQIKDQTLIHNMSIQDKEGGISSLQQLQITPIQLAKQILEKNKQYFEKQTNQKSSKKSNSNNTSNISTPSKLNNLNSTTYIQSIKKQYLTSYKQNLQMSPKIKNKPQMREDSVESNNEALSKDRFFSSTIESNKQANENRQDKLNYIISQVKHKIDLQDYDQQQPQRQESSKLTLIPQKQRSIHQRNSMIEQQCQKLIPDNSIEEHNLELKTENQVRLNNHHTIKVQQLNSTQSGQNQDSLRINSLSKILPSKLKQPTVINKTPSNQAMHKLDNNKLNQTAKLMALKQRGINKVLTTNSQGTTRFSSKRNSLQSGILQTKIK
ncbi:UNKNOWN [Stylonychia lemnae]|uniref:Uncharacterized protein n=1 Tax=Stylonychia lemnae TaxID=5949 RepID=A0A077ZRX9_STYLE|nr:UNKNOWN [Stylonychia lemnae]|eukprot:CDW72234.1 UNKNOWN [Stylonychia lemnae]